MKYKFTITGLDCPNCAAKLAKLFEDDANISVAKINFLTERLTVESELDEQTLINALSKIAKSFDKAVKIEK